MNEITFERSALDDYSYWALIDKKVFKKINILIKDIIRDPFSGIGKPEALKYELTGYWSRRIKDDHRLVYKIEEDQIIIAQCKGHYLKN
jgi:toxin YoeB